MIRPEDDDERMPVLRQRLMISGELARRQADSFGFGYGEDLEAAVRRFQFNHGLRITGRVDKPTLQALNVPAEARLAQLRANLQRLRELMAQRIEERYILVNVAAFQLEAVERHQVELRHRVIAGKPERQTPLGARHHQGAQLLPLLARAGKRRHARSDPAPRQGAGVPAEGADPRLHRLLQRARRSIPSPSIGARPMRAKLRFRQDPGPQNALGLVRLDMPNEHGVYMHDTPMKPLFGSRGRAFSAGCVRVQDVFTLAEWVARYEPGWERPGRAREILDAGNAFDLNLTRPVPVYFAYITAWAEPGGDRSIQFRPDIYGRDGSAREPRARPERRARPRPGRWRPDRVARAPQTRCPTAGACMNALASGSPVRRPTEFYRLISQRPLFNWTAGHPGE